MGEIRCFSPDFSREVLDFPFVFPDISRGKNPANSRGKSGAITRDSDQKAGEGLSESSCEVPKALRLQSMFEMSSLPDEYCERR